MTTKMNKLAALSVSLAAMAAIATPAFATDGYFSYGFGARQKALGGAGVADGRDATTTSLNPAGLTNVGTEVSAAMTIFSPSREFEGGAIPGFTPTGTVEFAAGDLVRFPEGLSCTWTVVEKVRKRYLLG